MAQLFFPPVMQASDASGNPYSGAKLYFYTTGTTTLITIYQDSGLVTPHTNPVIADSSGQFAPIYLAETTYKIVLKSSLDVTIRTVDPVVQSVAGAVSAGTFTTLSFTGALTSPYSLVAQGRLTLESGVAVSTTDQLAKGNLYYTPHSGNAISLYSGTAWVTRTFSEVTLALTLTSGKPYDIFAYDNSGVVALESLVWTNDTTRATALVRQDGVWCKTGVLTRRYIGTIYASAGNQCEDSAAKRFVWNMYNRVRRHMSVYDATNSWNYTLATIRQANAAVTNQLDMVRGLDEDNAEAGIAASFSNGSANVIVTGGIGLDATNALAADSDAAYQATLAVSTVQQMRASYRGMPGVGRHFLTWLEYSTATGTTTWYGDNNVVTIARSGIQGSVIA